MKLEPIFTIEQSKKSNVQYLQETKLAYGRIYIGNFQEKFMIALNNWSIEDYKKQWQLALKRLATHNKSCFAITVTSTRFFYWALYKEQDIIYIQNIFLLEEYFVEITKKQIITPENCFNFIVPRKQYDEDGEKISEWSVRIKNKKNKILFFNEKFKIKVIDEPNEQLNFVQFIFPGHNIQERPKPFSSEWTIEQHNKQWQLAYDRFNKSKQDTCFISYISSYHQMISLWIIYQEKDSIIIQKHFLFLQAYTHYVAEKTITPENSFSLIPPYARRDFNNQLIEEWKVPFIADNKGNRS